MQNYGIFNTLHDECRGIKMTIFPCVYNVHRGGPFDARWGAMVFLFFFFSDSQFFRPDQLSNTKKSFFFIENLILNSPF